MVAIPPGCCLRCVRDSEDVKGGIQDQMVYLLCTTCFPDQYCSSACREEYTDFIISEKECTCEQRFVLDIEICQEPDELEFWPRRYRQVSVSKSTTFNDLHHIIMVAFSLNAPNEYIFCDPSWNRSLHNTDLPDDASMTSPSKIEKAIRKYQQEVIDAGRIKLHNEANFQSQYDSNTRLAAWIGHYEERVYFWYLGFHDNRYNCFLVTLKSRMTLGDSSRPMLLESSKDTFKLNPTTYYGDPTGDRSWQAPYDHFGRLTTKKFMARHDQPSLKASDDELIGIRAWLFVGSWETDHDASEVSQISDEEAESPPVTSEGLERNKGLQNTDFDNLQSNSNMVDEAFPEIELLWPYDKVLELPTFADTKPTLSGPSQDPEDLPVYVSALDMDLSSLGTPSINSSLSSCLLTGEQQSFLRGLRRT
ncbi:hypothetical protein BKA61DRAFT_199905 [Leptodontidium sp. MPI-SDFR-AT-0119]|nr:hypothetical protein BKA61DRAFT_199905 [Leptodontidium sp. MPI-SDFR-AT-0119]